MIIALLESLGVNDPFMQEFWMYFIIGGMFGACFLIVKAMDNEKAIRYAIGRQLRKAGIL